MCIAGVLKHLEKDPGPHLVVVPASLLENWERWAPQLDTCAVLAQACMQGLLPCGNGCSTTQAALSFEPLRSGVVQLPNMPQVTSTLHLKVQAAKLDGFSALPSSAAVGSGFSYCYHPIIVCCRELERWCPSLKVVKYYGKDRAVLRQELDSWRWALSGRIVLLCQEMDIIEFMRASKDHIS